MEVIVSVVVKGPTQSLSVAEVDAWSSDRQAHPPVAYICPDEGPGGKHQLWQKSHSQH